MVIEAMKMEFLIRAPYDGVVDKIYFKKKDQIEIGHQGAVLCHLANIAIELKRELHWDGEREIFKNDAHANAMLRRPVRTGWET